MATTNVLRTDAFTNELYQQGLYEESLKKAYISTSIGDDNILMLKEELGRRAGDKITYQLTTIPTNPGRTENEPSEGHEAALSYFTDSLLINELNFPIRVKGDKTIASKRIGWDQVKHASNMAVKQMTQAMDVGFFSQIAGNTATSFTTTDGVTYSGGNLTKGTGLNNATAPSTNRIIRAGGQSDDQSLTSSDTLTLPLVDAAVEQAKLSTPVIEPITVDGQPRYIMFISPEQHVDLKRDTTSAVQWLDVNLARVQGGEMNGPVFNGEVGRYGDVIFIETTRLPNGVHSSTDATVANTKRAVLCGRAAGCIGFGMSASNPESAVEVVEQEFDYGREIGINVSTLMGISKTVYNSEDYATVVVSTYAARHTS